MRHRAAHAAVDRTRHPARHSADVDDGEEGEIALGLRPQGERAHPELRARVRDAAHDRRPQRGRNALQEIVEVGVPARILREQSGDAARERVHGPRRLRDPGRERGELAGAARVADDVEDRAALLGGGARRAQAFEEALSIVARRSGEGREEVLARLERAVEIRTDERGERGRDRFRAELGELERERGGRGLRRGDHAVDGLRPRPQPDAGFRRPAIRRLKCEEQEQGPRDHRQYVTGCVWLTFGSAMVTGGATPIS